MRLTNADRQSVLKKALAARFDDPNKAIGAERAELACRVYDAVVPEQIKKWVAKAPKGWVQKSDSIYFNVSGHGVRFSFPEELAVPHRGTLTVTDESLRDLNTAIDQRAAKLKEERETVATQLMALLNRVSTLGKLREIWPEGEPFYSHLAPKDRVDVPAVQVADINRLLGIAA